MNDPKIQMVISVRSALGPVCPPAYYMTGTLMIARMMSPPGLGEAGGDIHMPVKHIKTCQLVEVRRRRSSPQPTQPSQLGNRANTHV